MKHSASALSETTRSQIYGSSTPSSADNIAAKGYVQIVTSLGTLNLQIHCDVAPKISKLFLSLCETTFFDNRLVDRLIQNLILDLGQVDKSSGQIDSPSLPHNAIGILTSNLVNDSVSFSITLSRCPHFDGKQTVFGRVVGGIGVLNSFNSLTTDGNDRPIDAIRIDRIDVLSNPFSSETLDKMKKKQNIQPTYIHRSDPMANHPHRMSLEIGKYIDWTNLPEASSKKLRTASKPWSFTNW
jgi:cyclophilin family peptidyl-prolyl cis-trans isomerase